MATDINQATAQELERTFEVNREKAQALINKRNELGGFKSWDDVKKVPGFSQGMVENLQQAGLTLGSGGGRSSKAEGESGAAHGRSHEHGHGRRSSESEGQHGGGEEAHGHTHSGAHAHGTRSAEGGAGSGGGAQVQSGGKVRLNHGDIQELMRIPGVGETRAQQLLEWRQQHGPFKSWEDVDAVPGFTGANLEHVKSAATLD